MGMRSIHFGSELLFVPFERVESESLEDSCRNLYGVLAKSRLPLKNISLGEGAIATIRTKLTEGYRRVVIQPDRLIVEEEWAESTVDDFSAWLQEVAGHFLSIFNMQFFAIQRCTVRAVFPCPVPKDTRDFIGFEICRLSRERIEAFPKWPGRVGLRFGFFGEAAAPALERVVLIESWGRDPKQIFAENQSVFPEPVNAANLGKCKENLKITYDFINKDVQDFLGFKES